MNRPNRALLVSGMLALLIGAALFYPAPSSASSGSTWKMTIDNQTAYPAHVEFCYMSGALQWTCQSPVAVAPGTTKIYDVPGAKCPAGFRGHLVVDGGREATIRTSNCLGTSHSTDAFSACCWNVVYGICKNVTTSDPYVRDNDYGFCKR